MTMTAFKLQVSLPVRRVLAGASLVLSLAAFSTFASAQQNAATPVLPSHLTSAVDVLKASGMGTMFQNSLPNIVGALRANYSRSRPELTKDIDASLQIVEAMIPEAVTDGLQAVGRSLAEKMSEEELKQVLTFMSSPAGKKYIEIGPSLMEEVVPFVEQWTKALNTGVNRLFQDEMLKRGHKL